MQASVAMQTSMPTAGAAVLAPARVLSEVGRAAIRCSTCNLKEHCMPRGLEVDEMRLLDRLVARRGRLRKGETVFRAGEKFTSLCAIHSGSCKTVLLGEDGQEQVAGYHMTGDIIGTGGIGAGSYDCEAVALEDMEICWLPFDRIEELARQNTEFQRALNRMLSREIVRGRHVTMMLGTMRADQRLATFLLDLSRRYQQRGYSSVEYVLRMTREEIGSYLGLKLETVSRLFSRFHQEGVIKVQGRVVKLIDRTSLMGLVGNEFERRTTGVLAA